MDKILERIVETDRLSREKVNERKKRLETINDEISSAEEEIDRTLREKAEKSIEETKKQMNNKLIAETERIDKYFSETENSLNRTYAENHDRWVNEIFGEVIK